MYHWWNGRKIPASRELLSQNLKNLGLKPNEDTSELLIRAYGLSLSDQYWLCPEGSGLTWKDVNFFDNPFSDDIGEALFDNIAFENASFVSPDSSLGGGLKKKWKIIDGDRFLVKSGTRFFPLEPFTEVFANRVCEVLSIENYLKYELQNGSYMGSPDPVSICKCFVDPNTELVPAYDIIYSPMGKKFPYTLSGDLSYNKFVNIAEALGVSNIRKALSDTFVLDLVLNNHDRHYNNFGLIRDVNSLKFIGVAPIFDNGYGMYAKSNFYRIDEIEESSELYASYPIPCQKLIEQKPYIKFSDYPAIEQLSALKNDFFKLYMSYNIFKEEDISKLWSRFEVRLETVRGFCREYSKMTIPHKLDNIVADVQKRHGTQQNTSIPDKNRNGSGDDAR